MATPWIPEPETGRWYINYTEPNGQIVRRYSNEVYQDSTPYQPAYQQNVQDIYQDLSAARGQPPSRHTREAPRLQPPLSPGRSNRRQSVSQTERSGRSDRRYHDDQGYNRAGDRADDDEPFETYEREVPVASSSTRDDTGFGNDSMSSATVAMGSMNLQDPDMGSSAHYKYSPPQQSSGLSMGGRSQYQAAPLPFNVPAQYGTNYNAGPASRASSQAPRAPIPIRGNPKAGETERLDPTFRMRNNDYKTFFRCGRVFKTLWTDPAGPSDNNASENDQFMSRQRFRVAHGQYVYSKIRRFVVVKQNDRSCQCLPVTTYDGKGYQKRGINLDQHGLIYSGDDVPPSIPEITKWPLKVKPAKNGEILSSNSYINYGRAYCVDTNVKVRDLGELDSESRKWLRDYYNGIHFADYEGLSSPKQQAAQLMGVGSGVQGSGYYDADLDSKNMSAVNASKGKVRQESFSQQNYGQSYDQASSGISSAPWSRRDSTTTASSVSDYMSLNPGAKPTFGDEFEPDEGLESREYDATSDPSGYPDSSANINSKTGTYGQAGEDDIVLDQPQRQHDTGERQRRRHRDRERHRY